MGPSHQCAADAPTLERRLDEEVLDLGAVLQAEGDHAGDLALGLEDGAEVEDFFVEPAFQGRGIGGALMATLLTAARAAGATVLEVDADPNAEAIYARLGFETFGRSPSGSIPGRWLPRMRMVL